MVNTTATTSVMGTKPLMTPAVTSSSGVGPEQTVTTSSAVLPTISSVVTTSTVTTLSYTTPSTMSLGARPRDVRVGWIYDLPKARLIETMEQYGLDTVGKSDDLRRRFSAFWKNQAHQGGDEPPWLGGAASSVFSPTTSDSLSVPVHHVPPPKIVVTADQEANAVAELGKELEAVKMLLGLSPNADSRTLRETLASVVQQSRGSTPLHETGLPYAGLATLPPTSGLGVRPEVEQRPVVGQERSTRPTTLELPAGLDDRRTTTRPMLPRDCPTVCNMVRKWGLKFDGRRDPVSFLERVQELTESYSLTHEDLLKALPELLQGSALLWYRNCKDLLYSFDAFRRQFEIQFLPPGYRRNLDEEIRKRTQGENEHFRDFVTAITTLIRRSNTLSEQGKLDLIFKNMRPEYKLMVRRQDCATLADMMEKAEDYEAYLRDKASFRPPPAPNVALVQETAYVHKKREEKRFETSAVVKEPSDNRKVASPQVRQGSAAGTGRNVGSNGPRRNWTVPTSTETTPSTTGPRCFRCQEIGHMARGCRKPRVVKCFGCGRPGVTLARCGCRAGNAEPAQSSGGQLSVGANGERPPQNGQSGSRR